MGWTSAGSKWITLYWVISPKLKPNSILKFKWTYHGQTVGDPEIFLTPELTPSSLFQTLRTRSIKTSRLLRHCFASFVRTHQNFTGTSVSLRLSDINLVSKARTHLWSGLFFIHTGAHLVSIYQIKPPKTKQKNEFNSNLVRFLIWHNFFVGLESFYVWHHAKKYLKIVLMGTIYKRIDPDKRNCAHKTSIFFFRFNLKLLSSWQRNWWVIYFIICSPVNIEFFIVLSRWWLPECQWWSRVKSEGSL
jgi:hypothetical protein